MAFPLNSDPPPTPPVPPQQDVVRFEDGKPTRAQIEYERKVLQFERDLVAWARRVASAIP